MMVRRFGYKVIFLIMALSCALFLSGYAPFTPAAQRGWTKGIPDSYRSAASKQGVVTEIRYTSKDYAGDGRTVQKKALVYLPYGYNGNDTAKRYDIFYMMHGLGETADSFFLYGGGLAKNLLDNMIEKGDISPMIVVAATFDPDNAPKDIRQSDSEVRQFHRDLLNDLMPAVEGKYHTYAMDTSKKGLASSRDHRAFGGFSMGAVTTWFQFCHNYDYIRYFLPMSCSCWYYGGYGEYHPKENCDLFEKLIRENRLNERGYFIYSCTGTNDVEQGQVDLLMDEMLKRSSVFTPDHLLYYKKNGGMHDMNAGLEYIYNGLPLFFKGLNADSAAYYDLYSNFEKLRDPAKGNAGLYFFKGTPGGAFIVCVDDTAGEFTAGQCFYHAYELSLQGYNTFALKYRPGDKEAREDLARAIAIIHENADVLKVGTKDYCLWGGASGAQIVSDVFKKGTAAYGAGDYPRAASLLSANP